MLNWKIIGASLASLALTAAAPEPRVGEIAPAYELRMMDGTRVPSEALKGDVVILNFWATWCGPCRKELPLLHVFSNKLKQHGLHVYAVATEDSVPAYQLKKLFQQVDIQQVRSIRGGYGPMKGVPTNFVIDRAGRLRYAKAGAFELDELNALIIPLLREPRPVSTQ